LSCVLHEGLHTIKRWAYPNKANLGRDIIAGIRHPLPEHKNVKELDTNLGTASTPWPPAMALRMPNSDSGLGTLSLQAAKIPRIWHGERQHDIGPSCDSPIEIKPSPSGSTEVVCQRDAL